MERTTQQDGTEPDKAETTAGRTRDSAARARAYLDLWEQHVVQMALHGPDSPWRQSKS